MCQGVTPVPYAPGRLQFRCDRCGTRTSVGIPASARAPSLSSAACWLMQAHPKPYNGAASSTCS